MSYMALYLICYGGLEEADRVEVFDLAADAEGGIGSVDGDVGVDAEISLCGQLNM